MYVTKGGSARPSERARVSQAFVQSSHLKSEKHAVLMMPLESPLLFDDLLDLLDLRRSASEPGPREGF